jgi:hypothetical protein
VALSERLQPDGRQRYVDRVSVAVLLGEPVGHRFQGVQLELPKAFTLEYHPVVVPAGEQLPADGRGVGAGEAHGVSASNIDSWWRMGEAR